MKQRQNKIIESKLQTPRPSFTKKLLDSTKNISSLLKTAGLILAVSFLLYPRDSYSEDKKVEPVNNQITVAQVDKTNVVNTVSQIVPAQTDKSEIINKLPKVSLKEMQALDFKTMTQYKDIRLPDCESFDYYTTSVSVDFFDRGDGKVHGLAAHYHMCKSTGCFGAGASDKAIVVASDGRAIDKVDLTPLSDMYKELTGKELIYAKIVVEHSIYKDQGELVELMIVPVDKPGQEIKAGSIMLWTAYSLKTDALRVPQIAVINE